MRKLVIILACTSAVLAVSTAYFAYELAGERARNALARPVAGGTSALPPRGAALAQAQAPAATPHPAAPDPEGQVSPFPRDENAAAAEGASIPESIRNQQKEIARRYLAQLATSEGRAVAIDEHKMMFRQIYPNLDRALNLTRDEYAKLLELLALQQLDSQERAFRCIVDPGCDPRMSYHIDGDTTQQQIVNLIGAERNEKFERYKNTSAERESVTQMRLRLPDAQRLSDESAEALIAVLAEEREALYREAAQLGSGTSSIGTGVGMVFVNGSNGSSEDLYEAARRNSQRLRDRVRPHLSPEQMRVFDEMQDETLVSLRTQMRHKESGVFPHDAAEAAAAAE